MTPGQLTETMEKVSEKDIEREASNTAEELSTSEKVLEKGIDNDGETDTAVDEAYEPIRSATASRIRLPRSRSHSRSVRSLDRMRSNNGYGVDDLDETSDDVEGQPNEDKDPFEVTWEGGDQDPLCPRGMALWRKWLIVCTTSFGSFCV